jgi:hypothetical protein
MEIDGLAFAAWPIVFGLNLVIPLLLGWDMTREHGRIGVFLAAALLLTSGWAVCYARPSVARRLILGSTLTALSQLFPILQIVAGCIAVAVADSFALLGHGGHGGPAQFSEPGGFIVTLLVGCILLTFAGTTGWVLGLLLPKRWLSPNKPRRESKVGGLACSPIIQGKRQLDR